MSQQIEFDGGNNPWVNLIGLSIGVGLILIAIAAWQISVGLSIGCAVVGVGYGGRHLLCGIAEVVRARGDAQARVISARAEMIDARTQRVQVIERPIYRIEEKHGS